MKKIILSLSIGLASVTSWSACTAGAMSLTGAVNTGNLNDVVSISGQKIISFTKKDITLESMAQTSNNKLLPNSNIVAFEYKTVFPTGLVNNEAAAGWLLHSSKTNSEVTSGALLTPLSNKDGLNLILVGVGNPSPLYQSSDSISMAANRIGIYINRQTKQIGYILNGVNKGYKWSFQDNINDIGFILFNGFDGFASSSSNLGKEVSFELITDHSSLQFTYPTGATDICGTAI